MLRSKSLLLFDVTFLMILIYALIDLFVVIDNHRFRACGLSLVNALALRSRLIMCILFVMCISPAFFFITVLFPLQKRKSSSDSRPDVCMVGRGVEGCHI